MTVQAFAWAIEQPIPGTAKLVLIALANAADHTTGCVQFDPALVASTASITPPSLWRYLGALERNGYLAKEIHKSAEGERREYWLMLDREPGPWNWSAQEDDGERSDADGAEASEAPAADSGGSAPRRFDRSKQDAQRKIANTPDLRQPDGIPIIEGSRAYRAWCQHLRERRQPVPYVRSILAGSREHRGFLMPTLFPPASGESAA